VRGGCLGYSGHVMIQVFLIPPRRAKPQAEEQRVINIVTS
jgi:hypothetical protein